MSALDSWVTVWWIMILVDFLSTSMEKQWWDNALIVLPNGQVSYPWHWIWLLIWKRLSHDPVSDSALTTLPRDRPSVQCGRYYLLHFRFWYWMPVAYQVPKLKMRISATLPGSSISWKCGRRYLIMWQLSLNKKVSQILDARRKSASVVVPYVWLIYNSG